MINSKERLTDICVLGGGPAGYVAAIRAAQLGAKVTLIEAREVGVKAEVLADVIHPHPALAEAVMEACGDAIGRAIHK